MTSTRTLLALGVILAMACRTTDDARPPEAPATPDASTVSLVADAAVDETSVAIAPAIHDAAIDSGGDASPGVACVIRGKPCTPRCAEIAAKYLAMPPDGSARCDPKTCAAVGGLCDYAGFCFGQACIKKTRDGGRACTDGSQCETQACLAPTTAARGPGGGTCARVVLTLGCHAWVTHGVVGAALCGD